MTADWNSRAETYTLDNRESLMKAYSIVKSECRSFGTAADIGCGPGNFTYPLSVLFENVYASDLSPNMLARVERICAQRGIGNVRTVLSDALELSLPGPCDLAFSSLCPGIRGLEGMQKLDSLSEDLCMYITHDPDESTIENVFYDDLGITPFTSGLSVDYIDEFGETRDINVVRVQDSNVWRDRDEAVRRFTNMTDGTPESKERVRRYFEENDPEGTVTKNGKIIVYWHKED